MKYSRFVFVLTLSAASSFIFTMTLAAPVSPNVKWTLESAPSAPDGKEAKFSAPEGHHFNVEAPSVVEVLMGKDWVKAEKIEIQGRELVAKWNQKVDTCHVKATLYVCDDKNTYCLPRTQEVNCKVPSKKGFSKAAIDKALSVESDSGPGVIPGARVPNTSTKTEENFIENDTKKALDLAKSSHKPLLIDFYGIWCPPCNQLNETVFNQPGFQKASGSFVLLKLDVDSPPSWELKSKYKIKGYPTVIFASETGSEISRIVGSRDEKYFVDEMKKALKEQDRSFEIMKDLADENGDSEAAYKVGLIYLDREEFPDAHYYLTKASRAWKKGDPRNGKLLGATLGLYNKDTETPEGKLRYAHLLKDALLWYSHTEEALDRASELVKVSESLDDKEGKKLGLNEEIKFAEYYLKHPKEMRAMDETVSGLYEVLGDAYNDLGEKAKSQESFRKAADSYLADIKSAGLDENNERAYNLERIYCIWKSGDTQTARAWYEKLEKTYPAEFTFYFQHAKLLQDIGEYKEASEKATKALEFSYGDNKLRVVGLTAELYNSLKEKDKALKVLDDGIAQAQLPSDKSIRTYRYYDKLKTMRKKISGA